MHRGEIVSRVVSEHGISKSALARKMKVDRSTIYSWLEDPDLSFEKILSFGKALNHDFNEEFSFSDFDSTRREGLSEPLHKSDERYKQKYMNLLESHTQLLVKYQQQHEELIALRSSKAN